MTHQLINNREQSQYEFNVYPSIAKVEYIITQQHEIYLTHTEVSEDLEGQGIASDLVLQVLQDIEKSNLRLVPLCPFVVAYIKRHPEWRRLVIRE